jgi:hypothetical protein
LCEKYSFWRRNTAEEPKGWTPTNEDTNLIGTKVLMEKKLKTHLFYTFMCDVQNPETITIAYVRLYFKFSFLVYDEMTATQVRKIKVLQRQKIPSLCWTIWICEIIFIISSNVIFCVRLLAQTYPVTVNANATGVSGNVTVIVPVTFILTQCCFCTNFDNT